jgi:hypothetical protein
MGMLPLPNWSLGYHPKPGNYQVENVPKSL